MNLIYLAQKLYELNLKKISSRIYNLSNIYQNSEEFEDRYSDDIKEELDTEYSEEDYLNKVKYLEKNLSNEGNIATNPNKPLNDNIDPKIVYDILEQNDFHVIGTGSNPSGVLGHGAYAYVLGGTYKGLDCVAKVIVGEFLLGEANNWLKILSLKVPRKLKKHIPNIYVLRRKKIKTEDNIEIKYEIIIMERLYPFKEPGVMRGYLYSAEIYSEALNYFIEVLNLLKNPDLVTYLSKEILSELLEFKNRKYSGKIITPQYLELFISTNENYRNIIRLYEQIILDLDDLDDRVKKHEDLDADSKNLLRRKYENKFLSYTNKLSVAIFDLLYEQYNLDDTKHIRMIERIIKDSIESSFQTEQPNQSNSKWYAEPQTKTFIELLNYFRDNGIIYSDLHDQNIMVSKDNTLKFIDVGLWEMPIE